MVTTAPPGNRAPRSSAPRIRSVREQRAESLRFRRALTLVTLSAIAPGSAQWMAGNRRLGTIMLRLWVGMVVVGGLVLWLVPLDQLARLAVRPWLLNLFTLLAFAVALGWTAALVDAWRLGNPPRLDRRHRLMLVGATLALIAVVSTPLVVAARYAAATRDAVVKLFPTGEAAAASDGRLNVLLLGADAAEGREGVRPDSVNVVSIDVRSGRPVLISLPRNLEQARFAEDSAAAAEFPAGLLRAGGSRRVAAQCDLDLWRSASGPVPGVGRTRRDRRQTSRRGHARTAGALLRGHRSRRLPRSGRRARRSDDPDHRTGTDRSIAAES